MPPELIVSDWNGTLFEYPTDEQQNKKIALGVLEDVATDVLKGKLWQIPELIKLGLTRTRIKNRLEQYEKDSLHLRDVYDPFNRVILRGRSVGLVNSALDEYSLESAHKVDERMLRPIANTHDKGTQTGILSLSFYRSIIKILERSGFGEVFDDVHCNHLRKNDGRVVGLTYNGSGGLYGRKPEVIREMYIEEGVRPKEIIYMGNSFEDDAPVAEILPPGNFIVPFYATDEFKQEMAKRYKAKVPESKRELDLILGNR